METISFSVDAETKQQIAKLAKQQKKSKSDVFRDAWTLYNFNRTLTEMQTALRPVALRLGIETDDDVERYLG